MAKRSKKTASVIERPTVPEAAAAQASLFSQRDWFWDLILILAVIVAYLPVRHAGFIWDDDKQLQANPCIVGPLGLKEIWTTSAARFFPMTLTTFWLEHAVWGLNPFVYHLTNVLQHAACAVVLWRVLLNLQVPGAWLGAALWALHPVEVESVAWIAEMKNTQSALFFLLSILFFVQWLREKGTLDPKRRKWKYALALLFAALAMLSKSSTVILPIVLCLCAWWLEGRWKWRTLAGVGPVFLISIVFSTLTLWAVKEEGVADKTQWGLPWPTRLATAGDAIWFYLGKLAWPYPLITVYPRWQIDATQCFSYAPLLLALASLFVLWWKHQDWARPYFFTLAYFVVALLPILGLVYYNFLQYASVADHFQYLASMGPLALLGAGIVRVAEFVFPLKTAWHLAIYAGLLLLLGAMSWHRTLVYKSQETLWTDTLTKNPDCWTGYVNLGGLLAEKGRSNEAMYLFQKALAINPDSVNAHNNLGIILFQKGQIDDAIDQFQTALKIDPNYDLAHSSLGSAFLQKGLVDNAIVQLRQFLEMRPNSAIAHGNLGSALLQKGQVDEAITQLQEALQLQPDYVHAQENLAKAQAMKTQASGSK